MKLDTSEVSWKEFEKYKVSEGEYDFSNASEEEIIRVYQLLEDDDEVFVIDDTNETHNVQKHHIDDMLEEAIEELDVE